MRVSKDIIKKGLEYLYIFIFIIFIMYFFINTTMFKVEWPNDFLLYIRTVLAITILIRLAFSEEYTVKEGIICFVVCFVLGIAWRKSEIDEIINTLLLIMGAKGISFRKILRIYLAINIILLLCMILAALTGHIENLVYYQEGRNMRMSFGAVYPTDFSAHILYSALSYCYLRREKIRYTELSVIGVLGIFVYFFCQARLNTICIFLIVILFGYYKNRVEKSRKKTKTYEMNGCLSMILALSPVICAGTMVLLSMFFNPYNKTMEVLDRVLNYRLRLSRKAFDVYGVWDWGQYIPMQGNGGTTEKIKNYFFLDSSYIFILFRYGLLVFGVILFVMISINFQARKKKEWIILLTFFIISVQCMVEHHLMDIAYNPFLWLLFSDMDSGLYKKIQNSKDLVR